MWPSSDILERQYQIKITFTKKSRTENNSGDVLLQFSSVQNLLSSCLLPKLQYD
jgi:hypothetical protein